MVIALGADSRSLGGVAEVKAFATPTVVHFCAVLAIAAITTIPRQTPASLSVCFSLAGAVGVVYATVTALRARRQTGYAPVLEDWLWHAGFPSIAYAALLVTGITAYHQPIGALYFIGAIAVSLLFIGIHNAWDAAVFISMHKREHE